MTKQAWEPLDRVRTPDLWPDIADREPDHQPLDSGPHRSPRSRIVAASLAIIVAAAAGALVVRAFAPGGHGSPHITPIRSGQATDLPVVVDLSCDGTTTGLSTPSVQPQADGVHFRVEHAAGVRSIFLWKRSDAASPSYSGFDFKPEQGVTVDTFSIGPGEYFVNCSNTGNASTAMAAESRRTAQPLNIVDEAGVWTSPANHCADSGPDHFSADGRLAQEAAIRQAVPGVLDSDLVISVGYPDAQDGEWNEGVERDGQLVAHARAILWPPNEKPGAGIGDAQWWIDVEACKGSGIGGK